MQKVAVEQLAGGSGSTTEAAAGQEHSVEAVGVRADAGQDYASGCAQKKVVKRAEIPARSIAIHGFDRGLLLAPWISFALQ